MLLKSRRLPLLATAGLLLVMVVLLAVALTPAFQTWAVRRWLAARPNVRFQVGEVAAGWSRVEAKNLRYEQGGAVLTVPAVEMALPVIAAGFYHRFDVSRCIARGWTLDLGKAESGAGFGPGVSHAGTTLPAQAAVEAIAGLFARLDLPGDLSMDGLEWEGEVILPESRGRVNVVVRGGGLRVGGEGKFHIVASAALRGAEFESVTASGRLTVAMNTPRSFRRVGLALDAVMRGAALSDPVVLHAEARADRQPTGESYMITVSRDEREILGLVANLPRRGEKLSGTWRIDLRDGDMAPFFLLKKGPAFSVRGSGAAEIEADFTNFAITGSLAGNGERLEAWRAELAPLDGMKLAAEFDLTGHGSTIAVRQFAATLAGDRPVASLRALQPFEWRPAVSEIAAVEPQRELFHVGLLAVPVAWIGMFARPVVTLNGSPIRGELLALPRNGGLALRSVSPLVIDDLRVSRAGQGWIERVSLTLNAAYDYTPHGWQIEIADLKLKTGDALLLSGEGRAGQLTGERQPIKTTGRVLASMAAWSAQPGFAGELALTGGEAVIGFTASVGATTGIEATVAGKGLVAMRENEAVKLPSLSATLRADVEADGRVVFQAPIALEREGRKSDVEASGTFGPERDGVRALAVEIAGANVVWADATAFQAVLGEGSGVKDARRAPWAGWRGSAGVRFDRLIVADSLGLVQVSGKFRLEPDALKLEGWEAALASGGSAKLEGALNYRAGVAQPFVAQAEVEVREFDSAPLLRTLNRGELKLLEGKFDVGLNLSAVAARCDLLAEAAKGEVRLTSRGGVFHGFPVTAGTPSESTGRLASIIASAGSVFGSWTSKKETGEVASRAEAVAELARSWYPIPFDQLSVVVTRDATGRTSVKEFTLIAPELRLTGSGFIRRDPGRAWVDDSLTMDYRLRARGRQAELLKFLGVLENHADDLGYAGCTMPLRVTGSLAAPDPMELNTKLAALALEKGGIVERATELFNKLRGTTK
ncbi:MAG: hypothetical protein ABIQ12_09065 [Opitutaceae bacterium]